MNKRHILLDLFITFFKMGVFTFGGGYVMIPLIEKEMVVNKKWIAQDEIVDIIAITQSIPGALAVNMSALVGYKIAKVKGAITAVFSVVLPSFIIIVLIAMFFTQFQDLKIIQNAFLGIRSMVVALILMSAVRISKSAMVDIKTKLVTIITVILLIFTNVHPILIILSGATFGLISFIVSPTIIEKLTKEGDKDDSN